MSVCYHTLLPWVLFVLGILLVRVTASKYNYLPQACIHDGLARVQNKMKGRHLPHSGETLPGLIKSSPMDLHRSIVGVTG